MGHAQIVLDGFRKNIDAIWDRRNKRMTGLPEITYNVVHEDLADVLRGRIAPQITEREREIAKACNSAMIDVELIANRELNRQFLMEYIHSYNLPHEQMLDLTKDIDYAYDENEHGRVGSITSRLPLEAIDLARDAREKRAAIRSVGDQMLDEGVRYVDKWVMYNTLFASRSDFLSISKQ